MDELTKKQKGFVKDYVRTGNGTQAALNNYDIESDRPERVASVISAENLTKPSIQNAIKSIAERIPEDLLEKVHLEGLSATNDGMPDYGIRHKYLDSAYKLKGSYAPDKSVSLNIEAQMDNEELDQIANELIELRSNKQ